MSSGEALEDPGGSWLHLCLGVLERLDGQSTALELGRYLTICRVHLLCHFYRRYREQP